VAAPQHARLALFDLDDTLIRGDCEVLWSRFLTREGLHDMSRIEVFCEEYRAGTLDYGEFCAFQLAPLVKLGGERARELRHLFVETEVLPRLCETVVGRARAHLERGDRVLVVTAAQDFLARPIARLVGIEEGLYTRAERDGREFTGRTVGTPCFREGKITCLEEWRTELGLSWEALGETWFYSDSHNDLPLLRRVDRPVVVRPDERLAAVAAQEGWERLD
jgi:HAD superfamily hydrolase (TIGR01490 family)